VIKVFVAQNPTEAHFLKGLLESNGIATEVREALFGASGEVPVFEAFPELWVVDDHQVSEALKVLQNRSSKGDETPWRCAHCGETIEPQFAACWSCNAERPTLA
jgi:hypothetical protein